LAELDLGGLPIVAENDARALSYGEAVIGAGEQYASVLCVTIGTGIGGGIIINGEILHGANYSAGEIGYLVVGWDHGEPQILDQAVSGPGIERAYQAACGAAGRVPLPEISRRAQAGDDCARAIIRTKAREFGNIMGGFVASINPDALVIGGGVPQIGKLWWHAFETGFRRSVSPPVRETPILPATHGIEAVLLGAAMLAWHEAVA
jgi:glucokinase